MSLNVRSADPTGTTTVVKTDHNAQVVRVIFAALAGLGSLLAVAVQSQAQLEQAFPNVKWIGGAMAVCGLLGRMIQEILLLFNIHSVKTIGKP